MKILSTLPLANRCYFIPSSGLVSRSSVPIAFRLLGALLPSGTVLNDPGRYIAFAYRVDPYAVALGTVKHAIQNPI